MKKLFACSMLALTIVSCQKEKPSQTEYLTAHQWKLTAMTSSEPINGSTNIYDRLIPCGKDNSLLFKSDNTYQEFENALDCETEPIDTTEQTWSLSADEKQLIVHRMPELICVPNLVLYDFVWEIETLDENSMIVNYTWDAGSGITISPITYRMTFAK